MISNTIKGLIEASIGRSDLALSDIAISNINLAVLERWLQQDKIMSSESEELWGITTDEGRYQRISLDKHLHEYLREAFNYKQIWHARLRARKPRIGHL